MTTETRGIRNCNPGNIERTTTRWQGMSEDQSGDSRFIIFDHAKWGIRAIARILITYQDARRANDGSRIDSIQEIVERWAPPHENPTDVYADYVARMVNLSVHDHVDIYDYDTMYNVITALIQFENGCQPYDKGTIDQGLRLAGIDVPVKPLSESRTIKASITATASTSTAMIMEALKGVEAIIEPLVPHIDIAQYVMLGITMLSIGVTVWARIDDLNKERR